MAAGASGALSRDIRTLFDDGTAVGLTDRHLLDRFADRRDPATEAAFEVLVRRHGPMVLRVCRNALPDPNDALDAFQATFLVLVRRCASLRGLDSLGGWLCGVACRVAARARVETARRRNVEARAAARVREAVEPAEAEEIVRDDLAPFVQEEVRRLPEKYRAVVVLCYWKGLTQEQAASQLGIPLGTVRSRMARARDLLRRRFARRGVEYLAIGMESIRRLPPIPPELVQSTVQAAVRIAGGQVMKQVVSDVVVSLVHWMLGRTAMIKFGGIAAGVILVGLTGYGAGLAAQRIGDAPANPHARAGDLRSGAGAGTSGDERPAENQPDQAAAREKAERKAAPPIPVSAKVDIAARIIKLIPNGTRVKKGDVVCELDSAALRNWLVNQRIAVKAAEATYRNANLAREVAEIAVTEYREGVFKGELQDAEGNIEIAKAEFLLADAEFSAAKKEDVSLKIKRAELAVLRARIALEKAQTRKDLLVKYTYYRRVRELESGVKRAHSDELVKQATFELERNKEANLERQIAISTISAPIDGVVQLRTQRTPDGFPIREGITVREGQVLLSIEPVDHPGATKD
jgi:RNA polymerase sigma factor (sigma-70 family)